MAPRKKHNIYKHALPSNVKIHNNSRIQIEYFIKHGIQVRLMLHLLKEVTVIPVYAAKFGRHYQ